MGSKTNFGHMPPLVHRSPICRRCGAARFIRSTVKDCQRPFNTIEISAYECPHKEEKIIAFPICANNRSLIHTIL